MIISLYLGMKKMLLVLIIVLISCNKNPKKVFYYSTGEKKAEYFKDESGEVIGEHKVFFKNGKLKTIQFFENGDPVGVSENFKENGELNYRIINRKPLDSIYYYNSKGKVITIGQLKNNQREGWWNYYNDNGRVKLKYEYMSLNDTLFINQEIQYDSNQQIINDKSLYYTENIPDTVFLNKRMDVDIKYISESSNTSNIKLYLSKDVNDDFTNIDEVKLNIMHPSKNIFRRNFVFSKLGVTNLRGYFIERGYLYGNSKKKDTNLTKTGYFENKMYFNKKVYVINSSSIK